MGLVGIAQCDETMILGAKSGICQLSNLTVLLLIYVYRKVEETGFLFIEFKQLSFTKFSDSQR